jgi:hypothetical protein
VKDTLEPTYIAYKQKESLFVIETDNIGKFKNTDPKKYTDSKLLLSKMSDIDKEKLEESYTQN